MTQWRCVIGCCLVTSPRGVSRAHVRAGREAALAAGARVGSSAADDESCVTAHEPVLSTTFVASRASKAR